MLLTFIVGPSYASTLSVNCPSGVSPVYSTVSAALAASSPGDTINIQGTCNELLVIDRNITLQQDPASDALPAILDGTGLAANSYLITINSGISTDINKLTIRNAPSGAISCSGALSIENSTLNNGASGIVGIGLAASVTIQNSTVTNYLNIALSTLNGKIVIKNSTISNNGTSIGMLGTNSNVSISSSIIANSSGQYGDLRIDGGSVTSLGYNIIGAVLSSYLPAFTQSATDIIGANPLLGALSNNGGITMTMAPGVASPAIGAIPTASCPASPLDVDQRGAPKPGLTSTGVSKSNCDIGAYETGDAFLVAIPTSLNFGSVNVGSSSVPSTVVIANHGNDTASIGTASLTGPFSISSPLSVTSLPVTTSAGLSLIFSPSSAGTATGSLSIPYSDLSNSDNVGPLTVSLSGTGESVPASTQIQVILNQLQYDIENNLVYGKGKNQWVAKQRLYAFQSLLLSADFMIRHNQWDSACEVLKQAVKRSDGLPNPPDYIIGTGVPSLNQMIIDLRASMNCKPITHEKCDNDKERDDGNVLDH